MVRLRACARRRSLGGGLTRIVHVFFCSVPGHAEDGMQGRLSVS
jgi:hypothetical protein